MLGAGCVPELNTSISFCSKIQTETWSLKLKVYYKEPSDYRNGMSLRTCIIVGFLQPESHFTREVAGLCIITDEPMLKHELASSGQTECLKLTH